MAAAGPQGKAGDMLVRLVKLGVYDAARSENRMEIALDSERKFKAMGGNNRSDQALVVNKPAWELTAGENLLPSLVWPGPFASSKAPNVTTQVLIPGR